MLFDGVFNASAMPFHALIPTAIHVVTEAPTELAPLGLHYYVPTKSGSVGMLVPLLRSVLARSYGSYAVFDGRRSSEYLHVELGDIQRLNDFEMDEASRLGYNPLILMHGSMMLWGQQISQSDLWLADVVPIVEVMYSMGVSITALLPDLQMELDFGQTSMELQRVICVAMECGRQLMMERKLSSFDVRASNKSLIIEFLTVTPLGSRIQFVANEYSPNVWFCQSEDARELMRVVHALYPVQVNQTKEGYVDFFNGILRIK